MLRKEDTLVVWRLDRLGRSLKHLIELVENLEEKKVGFKSLQESIDTTTSGGKLVFHIFGALAEIGEMLGVSRMTVYRYVKEEKANQKKERITIVPSIKNVREAADNLYSVKAFDNKHLKKFENIRSLNLPSYVISG